LNQRLCRPLHFPGGGTLSGDAGAPHECQGDTATLRTRTPSRDLFRRRKVFGVIAALLKLGFGLWMFLAYPALTHA
jgi:hypothetical protein